MSKELEIFENPELGQLRVLMIDGEPWFVGRDAAEILGYKNTASAVRTHVDREHRVSTSIPKKSGDDSRVEIVAINKKGFMKLIFSGNRPTATAFQTWVETEVLPSLDREQKESPTLEEESPLDLQVALEEEREKNRVLTLEIYGRNHTYTKFSPTELTKHSILFTDFCKYISSLNPIFTENDIIQTLKAQGILDLRNGVKLLQPRAKYLRRGYFEILVTGDAVHNEGIVNRTTYVTPAGIQVLTPLFFEKRKVKSYAI